MIGIPYINSIFKLILAQSRAIQGRFYLCPQAGGELNMPSLDNVMQDTFTGTEPKVYPLAILLPPMTSGDYGKTAFKDYYTLTMYFIKTSGVDSIGQIQNRNTLNNDSLHTIPEDWHDMKRCAVSFMQVLRQVSINGTAAGNGFFLSDRDKPTIIPVTLISNDRVSGVCLQFKGFTNSDCTIDDYPSTFLDDITLPGYTDSHPSHKM